MELGMRTRPGLEPGMLPFGREGQAVAWSRTAAGSKPYRSAASASSLTVRSGSVARSSMTLAVDLFVSIRRP